MTQLSNKYFVLQIWEPLAVSLPNIHIIIKCLYFFQVKQKGESDKNYDNNFNIFWASYCSRTISERAKQTKWNFWDYNLFKSSHFFSLHLHLIYFYTQEIISLENHPHPGIIAHKKALEKCNHLSLFWRFCGTLFQLLCRFNL